MAPKVKKTTLRCSHRFESARLKAEMIRAAREHGRSLISELNQACKAWVGMPEKKELR